MSDPGMGPLLALALGALQGVAEFLPISSSGHLALAQTWLGVDAASGGHTFNIVVHAGTLVAVLLFYRHDLGALARAVFQPRQVAIVHHTGTPTAPVGDPLALADDLSNGAGSRPGPHTGPALADDLSDGPGANPGPPPGPSRDLVPARVGPPLNTARALLFALIVGTLPLALALSDTTMAIVLAAETSTRWIGCGFLITAALLAFSHRRDDSVASLEAPRPWQGLVIGLAQLVAILPGVSRSGTTMAAAMALGLGRLPAARFSFLLAIPAILGASLKESLDLWQHGSATSIAPTSYALGFAASFAVGSLTLRALMTLLVRVGLLPSSPTCRPGPRRDRHLLNRRPPV
ncbi:undecaprenyl-diphosphate phosphatase [Nannocystis sp.]|uniref:undecaprenyl-diphosphate phosphatase n=1 Tax=Nannocystis sp. TaxID=1962667 RepID=UPI0025ED364B|nr:undecaprenyl-diphosphate phosphatase [Nannocystis sp.]MBK7826557.1 undecaprenyl-diphosphate phosphatase [Nannocystis sp.]